MDDLEKEFMVALFVILYTMSISLAFANSGWQYSSDLDVYYANSPSRHPIIFTPIYFLFSNSEASFAMISAFLPSITFSIFMRKYGRKAAMLAAVAIPFVLIWQVMAQNFALLFFVIALGMAENRLMQIILFMAGNLAHRYAYLLGAMILGCFAIKLPEVWVKRTNVAILLLLIGFLLIRLYQNCFVFEYISRRFLIFAILLSAVFITCAKQSRQILFFMISIVSFAAVLAGITDGFRMFLFISPLSVLGISEAGRVPMWLIVCLLLVGSCLAVGDNWNAMKDVSHSAYITVDAVHVISGMSGQPAASCPARDGVPD